MATQVEVVYPSTSSFTGTAQLNLGPYFVPAVHTLIRCEVRGKINFQTVTYGTPSVQANFQLWAVQWVTHGSAPQDCITTADGDQWLIREQTGGTETLGMWAPNTDNAEALRSYPLRAEWAGQLIIGQDIDLYMSLRAPTGASIDNQNLFASIRFWWA